MNSRLGLLNPLNWALWIKFLVGIAIGLIILAVPAYLYMRENIFELGEQNALAFVTQLGVKQASAVNNALVQARTALDNFTENADNERMIIGYLLRNVRTDTQTYLPDVSNEQIAETAQL